MIRRGDIVRVSLRGDYGKPRPAVVIQSDLLADLDSVVICPITSAIRDAVFRISIGPSPVNGLEKPSQVMVDKPVTLPRVKVSAPVGRIEPEEMRSIERAILLVIGVA